MSPRAVAALLSASLPVAPAFLPAEARAWDERMPVLALAGDVDGDGGQDVALRSGGYRDDTGTYGTSVALQSGRTGAELWTAPIGGYLSFPVFARVGERGRDGVLAVSYDDALVQGRSHEAVRAVTVQAYDGSGRLWSFGGRTAARVVSTEGETPPRDDSRQAVGTIVYGVGDLVRGGGADVLVGTVVPVAGTWTMRVEVVDGADGTARQLGDVVAEQGSGIGAAVIGDVDGDGLDDIAVSTGGDGDGSRPVVRALSSGDAAVVWTGSAFPADDDVQVARLSDVTGDGTADLAVRVNYDLLNLQTPDETTVTLVDGRTGKSLWTKRGVAIEPLDRRGTTLVVRHMVEYPVPVSAYTRTGRARWTAAPRLSPPKGTPGYLGDWGGPVGDVDGDGEGDYAFALTQTYEGRVMAHNSGVIDGRTGRVLAHRQPRHGSGDAIDGRGADLVSTALRDGVLTVTAWDGRTGRTLWRSSVRPGRAQYGDPKQARAVARVVRLDGDRCADVLIELAETHTTVVAFDGSTGRMVWAKDAADDDSRPAAVGRVPARRYC